MAAYLGRKCISGSKAVCENARQIRGNTFDDLHAQLLEGELLYVLTETTFPEGLSVMGIVFGSVEGVILQRFLRIDSDIEFQTEPWKLAGWACFYSIPNEIAQCC